MGKQGRILYMQECDDLCLGRCYLRQRLGFRVLKMKQLAHVSGGLMKWYSEMHGVFVSTHLESSIP